MNPVLFVISNQPDNLGDVIQNRNLIQILVRKWPVIIDDRYLKENHLNSLCVQRSQLLSENKSLPNPRTMGGLLKLMIHFKSYEAVIRLPASVQYYGTAREIFREAANLFVYALLRFKGIKIYQFGMTCNPTKLHGLPLLLERVKSKIYTIYSVRDVDVAEQLKGLSFSNLAYCPDIFYWDAPNVYRSAISKSSKPLTILFSFRKTIPDASCETEYLNGLKQKVACIVNALDSDTKLVFAYQVPMDYEMNYLLYEQHKARGNCRFEEKCLDISTAETLYSQCNLVISNRQHVLLYGAKLGVPMLALTDTQKHWKLSGAIRDLGMSDYLADIHEKDEDIIARCKMILENEGAISQQLMAAVEAKREEAMKFLQDRLHLEAVE